LFILYQKLPDTQDSSSPAIVKKTSDLIGFADYRRRPAEQIKNRENFYFFVAGSVIER
jgi:hypothetical protein